MTVDRKEIVAVFENLERLEGDKKEIADEMKATIEAFAASHDVNKKAVTKAFKEWKAWKKDQAEYSEVDYESSELLVRAVPEMAPEGN